MKYKKIIHYILFHVISGLTFSQTCFSASIESIIIGFNLESCQQSRCLKIKSEKATSGNFGKIFILKNFDLELKNGKSIEYISGDFGYFDLDLNRLVLKNKFHQEIEIDIETINKRVYDL